MCDYDRYINIITIIAYNLSFFQQLNAISFYKYNKFNNISVSFNFILQNIFVFLVLPPIGFNKNYAKRAVTCIVGSTHRYRKAQK